MTTHFITAEVDVQDSTLALQAEIEAKLKEQGEPLRWAVTSVVGSTAQIEAVVTRETDKHEADSVVSDAVIAG